MNKTQYFWFASPFELKIGAILTPEPATPDNPFMIKADNLLEEVRLQIDTSLPSRQQCFFGARTKKDLLAIMKRGCCPPYPFLYKAEILDPNKRTFLADPEEFTELGCSLLSEDVPSDTSRRWALIYWGGVDESHSGLKELLYDGNIKISGREKNPLA